jgi:hypothetical protein
VKLRWKEKREDTEGKEGGERKRKVRGQTGEEIGVRKTKK